MSARLAAATRRLFSILAVGGLACLASITGSAHAATDAVADTIEQRAKACTGCHGPQGRSTPDGYVPRLAGKPAGYLREQLVAFRDGRRTNDAMAWLLANLDDSMLAQLADHFARLDVPYPPAQAAPLSPADARRAEQLVRDGDPAHDLPACRTCHGDALTGIAPRVPGLLGLPPDYLVAQLGAWRTGLRHGREPDCMATVARRLPQADVAVVVRWLATRPVPARSQPSEVAPTRWPLDCGDIPQPKASTPAVLAPTPTRGAYLATLGNCAGCHTVPGGDAYAGGRGLVTPFGTVYPGNLTPDPTTGIGGWSADDFWRALHEGRAPGGRRLLPAFPYPSYTHVTREDSDALFEYLRSLPPITRPKRAHRLRLFVGSQPALAAWQWLFFEPAPAVPARDRGSYLVRGLGHCAACHAPRNRFGASATAMTGGVMPAGDWYAPSLAPASGTNEDDLVALLGSGRDRHGSTAGPMASVVFSSLQHWRDDDLRAVARHLMALPAAQSATETPPPSSRSLELGARLYKDRCAECHGERGEGSAGRISPLAGNPTVLQPDPRNLVQILRRGGFAPATAANPRPFGMPPHALEAHEVAAVINHLRRSWGHRAGTVSELDVLHWQ